MREILFRGKTAKGKWVYGAYYKQTHFYGDEENIDCIITTTDVLSNDLGLDYEEVIPETVGQFTGAFDEKGERIFEGDILRETYDEGPCEHLIVVWVEEYSRFELEEVKTKFRCELLHEEMGCVVGNIHDTPELLKE